MITLELIYIFKEEKHRVNFIFTPFSCWESYIME